jgi:hypothetical protein
MTTTTIDIVECGICICSFHKAKATARIVVACTIEVAFFVVVAVHDY